MIFECAHTVRKTEWRLWAIDIPSEHCSSWLHSPHQTTNGTKVSVTITRFDSFIGPRLNSTEKDPVVDDGYKNDKCTNVSPASPIWNVKLVGCRENHLKGDIQHRPAWVIIRKSRLVHWIFTRWQRGVEHSTMELSLSIQGELKPLLSSRLTMWLKGRRREWQGVKVFVKDKPFHVRFLWFWGETMNPCA